MPLKDAAMDTNANATMSVQDRAAARARHLGYSGVIPLIRAKLGKRRAESLRQAIHTGLRSSRTQAAATLAFEVPPSFWTETDPGRLMEMITAPRPTAPTTAAANEHTSAAR